MPAWLELLLLAVASLFWPTLIVIVVLALRVSHPVNILVWFLAGGLLTTVAVGIAVVFAFQGSSFMSGSNSTVDPAIYLTMGLLSVLGAIVLLRGTGQAAAKAHEDPKAPPKRTKPPF